jgi:hypothetical protein
MALKKEVRGGGGGYLACFMPAFISYSSAYKLQVNLPGVVEE